MKENVAQAGGSSCEGLVRGTAGEKAVARGEDAILVWQRWLASPIWRRLLLLWMRAAASRTFWTAASSRPINTAMMAMTTSSSISVNADRRDKELLRMAHPLSK